MDNQKIERDWTTINLLLAAFVFLCGSMGIAFYQWKNDPKYEGKSFWYVFFEGTGGCDV